jgi:hypothetical protein
MKKVILVTLTIMVAIATINSIRFIGSYFDLIIGHDLIGVVFDETASNSTTAWVFFLLSLIVTSSLTKHLWRRKYMRGLVVLIELFIKICGWGMKYATVRYQWYQHSQIRLTNIKRRMSYLSYR